jgi:hypothetical protein
MKQPDKNSLRTQRRKNRNFNGSRCNRIAAKRLDSALRGYQIYVESDLKGGGKGFTKPGALKKW